MTFGPRLKQAKKPKQKKCRFCGFTFLPARPLQIACDLSCAVALGKRQTEKALAKAAKIERAADREKIAELKPLQYWLKRTQKAVNELRRAQDLAAGYGCITCDTHDAEEWHAGHCISVGASSAERFTYTNIHLQCRQCNYFGAGKAQEYWTRMPARVGQAETDRLKNAPRSRKWTREECQSIESAAKAKLKALERANNQPLFCGKL